MQKSLRTPRQQLLISLLVEARRARGMTQAEVALVLGKPQSFVAKYENGERRIDVIEFVDRLFWRGSRRRGILRRIEGFGAMRSGNHLSRYPS